MMVFILIILLLIILSPIAIGSLLLAPPAPTPQKAVEAMLHLAKVKAGDRVYDLGSGDGRIIITAAKKFGAKSVGFELSILHFLITEFRIRQSKLTSQVKIEYANFYQADLSDASVVTIFGRPATMIRVKNKLLANLKSKTRIVSYAFPIADLKPKRILRLKKYAPLYLY